MGTTERQDLLDALVFCARVLDEAREMLGVPAEPATPRLTRRGAFDLPGQACRHAPMRGALMSGQPTGRRSTAWRKEGAADPAFIALVLSV